MHNMNKYLTEETLSTKIQILFGEETKILIRKKHLGYFPDIRIPSKNLIIEFDGDNFNPEGEWNVSNGHIRYFIKRNK